MSKWDISQTQFLKNAYGSGEIAAFFVSHYSNSVFKICKYDAILNPKIIRIKMALQYKGAKPSVKGKKKPESIRL